MMVSFNRNDGLQLKSKNHQRRGRRRVISWNHFHSESQDLGDTTDTLVEMMVNGLLELTVSIILWCAPSPPRSWPEQLVVGSFMLCHVSHHCHLYLGSKPLSVSPSYSYFYVKVRNHSATRAGGKLLERKDSASRQPSGRPSLD
mmetsp:Transcript_10312/g.18228  ORF Transcript_10312/g.18228 Transcript_10312/m.18228 type:complete len:144 (+) Transcript_10312:628-1059(+)